MLKHAMRWLTSVHEDKWVATLLSSLYFFCILCGYFLLRPLREAMGLAGGVHHLSWLFMGTLGVTLVVQPLFGWLTTRYPRRVFVPVTYRFFMANLMVFLLLLQFGPQYVGKLAGYAFYVWLSVFNLFAISIFWAVMADAFTLEQGKRLFGFIAIGGTLGAIFGSAIVAAEVTWLGPTGLILLAIVLFETAVRSFETLRRRLVHLEQIAARNRRGVPTSEEAADSAMPAEVTPVASERPLTRGGAFHGMQEVVASPYLLSICAYISLMTVMSTFLYFAQARIVEQAASGVEERAAIFARIDLWTQIATLAMQIAITARVLRRFGVGMALALVPVLTGLGFVLLGTMPTLLVLTLLQVANRAGRQALVRPARGILFTVMTRDAKYKAQSFIDTFVYRGGDVVGALAHLAFRTAGVLLGTTLLLAAPLAVLWAAFGLSLGRQQRRHAVPRQSATEEALEATGQPV